MLELKLVAANDTFGALIALGEMLAGKHAVFITAPEINGKTPEQHGLPAEVDDSVALIVETSGSTGVPKRIELSRDALVASATAAQERLGGPGQWLLALPTNYIAGSNVLIRSLVAETQPILMNTSVPFTAEAFGRAASLMTGQRRYTSLVPTQLNRLAQAVDEDPYLLSQLLKFDAILIGGQAPHPEVLQKLQTLGVRIVVTYGMTETCGGCVYNGVPLEGVAVDLRGGVIEISGSVLANGFAPTFVTNDLGEFDATGKLTVLGRADRVLISGGIKIALDRVEQILQNVNGVSDVAASPIKDVEWGERVGVIYVGSPEVADDMAAALANDLGPAGRPVRILRVDKLPKLFTGKPDLQAIKKLFEEN